MSDSTITTLDLFAGAGGLSLGFERSELGFLPVLGVEHSHAAARTYKANFGCEVWDAPIEEREVFPEADVIVGGPPCQGFSPLGRDRDDESRGVLNALWEEYLRAVRQVKPKAFVIENVPEFQRSEQFARLLELLRTDPELQPYGNAAYGVLNAAEYGAPQNRKRGILIAVRDHGPMPWPPEPTHSTDSNSLLLPPPRTVRDAIANLPRRTKGFEPATLDDGRQHLHFGRRPTAKSLERYRTIPPGGNRFDLMRLRPDITPDCWLNKPTGTTDVMGRMWWDRPSPTIRTEFFKPEKGRYLHPAANRVISHREAARLQTFPDDFFFEGTKIEIARQIGNAVPPVLGTAIAHYVFDRIEEL